VISRENTAATAVWAAMKKMKIGTYGFENKGRRRRSGYF